MSDLDRRLADLAERQHSLVTLADVRSAGGNHRHADTRLRSGRWSRLERGVFHISGVRPTWEARLLAAVLAAGPGAVASHFAAAALLGIPGFSRRGVEVSIPRGRRYRREGVRSHESTDLDRCKTIVREGIPLTDPGRTLLDLGRFVGDRRLHRAIEDARRAGLVTWSDLIATLVRHARRGRPGIRRLRRLIAGNVHREEVTDSQFELLVIALIAEHGIPEPVLHHRVHDGERFVAEVDLAYPGLRIAIELDGSHHLEPDVRDVDQPRQNDLELLGWIVLRFSYRRYVRRPGAIVAEIRRAREVRLQRSP